MSSHEADPLNQPEVPSLPSAELLDANERYRGRDVLLTPHEMELDFAHRALVASNTETRQIPEAEQVDGFDPVEQARTEKGLIKEMVRRSGQQLGGSPLRRARGADRRLGFRRRQGRVG